MNKGSKIYVAGHRGMVGSSLCRALTQAGYSNIIKRTREELDLTDQLSVRNFFDKERPEYVFLAAAKVGGIYANDKYSADFIRENIIIEANIIDSAYRSGVKKLLFLGSACVYPKRTPQPIKEEYLLTGELEPTNEAYALAKIAGIKMCQAYNKQYGTNFISVMPTNLYGEGDNFDLENSHVIPALIRKFHEAKEAGLCDVVVWGTGAPTREFLYVDDLAEACIFLMNNYSSSEIINIGLGEDVSIKDLANMVKDVVGYGGEIRFDATKPDGTPKRQLDVSKIHALGWRHSTELRKGLVKTYEWYKQLNNEPKG